MLISTIPACVPHHDLALLDFIARRLTLGNPTWMIDPSAGAGLGNFAGSEKKQTPPAKN
jgi:hypothetical protein